jgi:hypothetical protein
VAQKRNRDLNFERKESLNYYLSVVWKNMITERRCKSKYFGGKCAGFEKADWGNI